jgi:hypothetical protein
MATLSANTVPATSTTFVQMVQRYRVDYSIPTLSSNAAAASTVTVIGLTTNSILTLTPRLQNNSSVVGVIVEPRCSTADELSLQILNASGSSITGSTQSGYLLQFAF